MTGFEPDADGLLDECATLEYILLGDLRDLLEDGSERENRQWLVAVLDALLETLPREFALRHEGGYLSEVLDRFPSWYSQVEQLRDEQRHLYRKLRQLRERIGRELPYFGLAQELRNDLRDWMNHLVSHHRHERRLVQTAFNLEMGVGD